MHLKHSWMKPFAHSAWPQRAFWSSIWVKNACQKKARQNRLQRKSMLCWGVRKSDVTEAIKKRMSEEDKAHFGFRDPGVHPPYAQDHHAPPKTGRLERQEQRQFASWLLLNGYTAVVWHRTDKPTGTTAGTPDFIVPILLDVLFIEFKLPGAELSKAQLEFKAALELKGHELYVCYSAGEAIALVKQKDRLI